MSKVTNAALMVLSILFCIHSFISSRLAKARGGESVQRMSVMSPRRVEEKPSFPRKRSPSVGKCYRDDKPRFDEEKHKIYKKKIKSIVV